MVRAITRFNAQMYAILYYNLTFFQSLHADLTN